MTDSPDDDPADDPDPGTRFWLKWAIRLGVVVLLLYVADYVVSNIDWSQVGDALKNIAAWQVALLIVLVLVKQVFNAAPLAFFVPGLGVPKATISDLGAATVATVAPPPGDLVVRFAMFRAWNIDTARGAAGLTLNTVLFYVLRFAAPLFGIVALIMINRFDDQLGLVALVSGLAAVAVAAGVVLIVRSESGAAWVGATAGRLVRRLKPDRADPDAWAQRMREFRGQVAADLKRRWAAAGGSLILMLVTEAVIFLLAVRFAGVPEDGLPALAVIGAFCIAFPLSALPFAGLGVMDAALFAMLDRETSGKYQAELFAALVLWRLVTMVVPLILGGGVLLFFRKTSGKAEDSTDSDGASAGSDGASEDSNDASAERTSRAAPATGRRKAFGHPRTPD